MSVSWGVVDIAVGKEMFPVSVRQSKVLHFLVEDQLWKYDVYITRDDLYVTDLALKIISTQKIHGLRACPRLIGWLFCCINRIV